jgi:glucose/arabinose dehydrogenase
MLRILLLVCAFVWALALPAGAQQLKLRNLATGLYRPNWVGAPDGDTHRVFVIEQPGRIRIVRDGVLLPAPFLDVDAFSTDNGREQGLLGLAFHPNYRTNGKYYVCFTDNTNAIVVRQYIASATPGFDVDISDTTNFIDVLGPVAKVDNAHNSGCLQFGPDGMLYVSIGDGGGQFDSGPGHVPVIGNAQSNTVVFGKILRIDVDAGPPWDPGDNPWSSDTDTGHDLVWAIGLRNPWRFSFDVANGDLYVGDVGQAGYEEVDWVPHAQGFGVNFGWKCEEGEHCHANGGCVCNLPAGTNPAITNPLHVYDHGLARCAIIGGVVYRGDWIPDLDGTYFFGDMCTRRIYTLRKSPVSTSYTLLERTAEFDPPGPDTLGAISSFGTDGNGEVLLADYANGRIYRVEAQCVAPSNYCASAPNSRGAGATISYTGGNYLSENDLTLVCSGLPPGAGGYFVFGQGRQQVPAGNGFACVRTSHLRYGATRAGNTGVATKAFDASLFPGRITPGTTWTFQFFYFDPAGGGTGYNWSDGLTVPFCY